MTDRERAERLAERALGEPSSRPMAELMRWLHVKSVWHSRSLSLCGEQQLRRMRAGVERRLELQRAAARALDHAALGVNRTLFGVDRP
jgi:hypothetical protein